MYYLIKWITWFLPVARKLRSIHYQEKELNWKKKNELKIISHIIHSHSDRHKVSCLLSILSVSWEEKMHLNMATYSTLWSIIDNFVFLLLRHRKNKVNYFTFSPFIIAIGIYIYIAPPYRNLVFDVLLTSWTWGCTLVKHNQQVMLKPNFSTGKCSAT